MDYCEGCKALEARIAKLEAWMAASPRETIEPAAIYTAQEAADLLRCSVGNIYDVIEIEDLAVIRTGSHRKGFRIKGSDLLAFMEDRTSGGPKPKFVFKHLK